MTGIQQLTYRLKKENIDEEKCIKICEFIVENRNLTYDEIMEKLLEFNVKNRSILNQVIRFMKVINSELCEKTKIIIDLRYCEKNNSKNEELENLYSKIFSGENKKDKINKPRDLRSFGTSTDTERKEIEKEKEEFVYEIVLRVINGEDEEELLKEVNMSLSVFKKMKAKYLPKNAELFVEYEVYVRNIKRVDYDKLDFYIEMLRTLLKFLYKILDYDEYEKYFGNTQNSNQKSIINGMINKYSRILLMLEKMKVIDTHDISIIDDINIRKYANEIRNTLVGIKYVKTNNVTNENQEKIYEIYKKKVNI